MSTEIITLKDLEQFRRKLIQEIREIFTETVRKNITPKEWLKGIEVRNLLGISSGTLQNMRLNGTLPFSKIGGLLYYKYEDILKLMDGKNDAE